MVVEEERHLENMREGQPDCSQLKNTRGPRIEHTTGNIDVRDCVTIENGRMVVKIRVQRDQGNSGRQQAEDEAVQGAVAAHPLVFGDGILPQHLSCLTGLKSAGSTSLRCPSR